MTDWRASLAGRVALATALASAFAALLAALVSWRIATGLIDQAEDRRLIAATHIFINDLRMRAPGTTLHAAIDEELAELAPASIRVAIYENGRHVGGDRLPISVDPCVATERDDMVQRSCSTADGPLTIVAASTRASGASLGFLLGAVAVSLAAAVIAALAGQRAARWAIHPLTLLTSALHRIQVEAPTADELPSPGNVREVAALRGALGALVQRLGDSLTRARRFSADAAHELRTPLTVLSTELDLLIEDPAHVASRAEFLRLRLRAGALARVVERLLVLATAERGPLPPADPVALEDLARQSIEALPEKDRARVRLDLEGEGFTRGDEALLSVLIDNALDNALKFSGDQPVTIRVSEATNQVVLDIIDAGPGLSPDERSRAFDAFFRSPAARAGGLPGHGIGLALVAQVSQLHGGSCAFLETEKGAHLRISLPSWRPAPGTKPLPNSSARLMHFG